MPDQARATSSRQHVLHDHPRAPGARRRAPSSTSSATRPTTRRTEHPFKGNVDLAKLEALIERVGAASASRTSARRGEHGRRPAGLDGEPARGARACRAARHQGHARRDARRRERLLHPAARAGLRDQDRRDPARDLLVHRRLHDERQEGLPRQHRRLPRAQRRRPLRGGARNLVVLYEGLHTYGGLAGRDMEAMAIGIASRRDDHIRARIGQVEYLGERSRAPAFPSCAPSAGTRCSSTRRRSCPTSRSEQFPAQALAAALYVDSGVRAMERGAVSAPGATPTRREHLPQARAGAADLPAPRLHAGAHGRHRQLTTLPSTIRQITTRATVVALMASPPQIHSASASSTSAPGRSRGRSGRPSWTARRAPSSAPRRRP
jgi:tyrosine phenol-lyase